MTGKKTVRLLAAGLIYGSTDLQNEGESCAKNGIYNTLWYNELSRPSRLIELLFLSPILFPTK